MISDDELIAALKGRIALRPSDERMPGWPRPAAPLSSIREVERAVGHPFDALLARVYTEVCDGGLGPGYGAMPLLHGGPGRESVLEMYTEFRTANWPEELVPIWMWGCAIWSCVDRDGRIVTSEPQGFNALEYDVRGWLVAWLDGVKLWDDMFEDRDVTLMNPFTRKPTITKARARVKGRRWHPRS